MKHTLREWRDLCMVNKCKWCGANLPRRVLHYPHPHGWEVTGMTETQWLYLHCRKCGYDHALWKLGVPGGGHVRNLPTEVKS